VRYRKLGRTEIFVSEIGFGTWGIGGESYGKVEDIESIKALRRAFELGINFFDTADIYGHGKSERLIANALGDVREKIIIASKVGYVATNARYDFQIEKQNFSQSYIKDCLKGSLDRLSTNYMDIYLLHSPPTEMITDKAVYLTLTHLKERGRVKYIGVSLRKIEDGFIAIESGMYDIIEITYNLVYQKAREINLLKKCYDHGIGIIIKSPLSNGFLTGKYKLPPVFQENDHRPRWPIEQINYWISALNRYSQIWRDKKWTNTQAALKFCLSTSYVSTVIPGMKTTSQVEKNASVANGSYFSQEEISEIIKRYSKIKDADPLLKYVKPSEGQLS
jgi:aryl-alcohol dehydrogenase-like predicted oxidoreductase